MAKYRPVLTNIWVCGDKFQNYSPEEGVCNKSVRRHYCKNNDEPEIGSDEVVAIFDYKSFASKGRKSPLAGEDILHIGLPTGPLRIPLDQAEMFGRYLIGAARSVIKQINTQDQIQTNDNTEQ